MTRTSAGNGHYIIIITNVSSGTVLDSVNCGIFDGTLTDLWASLGNACQEWDVSAIGSHYTISNVGNGRARRARLRDGERHRRPPVGTARQHLPAVGPGVLTPLLVRRQIEVKVS
ncbi:RICIN domain-containing protein [Trebonia kvetii]|uniref:RICIN domain-containing protein n=1 Tax=Trebonia kvetii TaxID=2480626 RepID=UPI001C9E4AC0|nr:RICIN domain-containing protein [Trebonia kvetii]